MGCWKNIRKAWEKFTNMRFASFERFPNIPDGGIIAPVIKPLKGLAYIYLYNYLANKTCK